jgi:hypothetical protein
LRELEQPLECHGSSLGVVARGVCDDNDGIRLVRSSDSVSGQQVRARMFSDGRADASPEAVLQFAGRTANPAEP